MDKTKTYQKLLQAHDALYNARERIEDLKVAGEAAEYMSTVLELLDEAEAYIDQVAGSPFWKRQEKETIEHPTT